MATQSKPIEVKYLWDFTSLGIEKYCIQKSHVRMFGSSNYSEKRKEDNRLNILEEKETPKVDIVSWDRVCYEWSTEIELL